MLEIRLYKNCILNDTYQNVFSTGLYGQGIIEPVDTILEKYLATLTSKLITVDNVYQENEGTLVFEYYADYGNIYGFNYMRIKSTNDNVEIKRYCFIQDIKLKNGLVYLDYEEDIWSSYSDKIVGITESYLCNSRVLEYGDGQSDLNIRFRKLPEEYASNENVFINTSKISTAYQNSAMLIVELQYYVPGASGEVVVRYTNVGIVEFNNSPLLSYSEAFQVAERIYRYTQVGNGGAYKENGGQVQCSYQVNNIYVIPGFLYPNLRNCFNQTAQIPDFRTGIYDLYFGQETNITEIFSKVILNDYKIKRIGTLTSQYDLIMNGTSFTCKIYVNITKSQFKILMDVQNKLIDITDDFDLNFPYAYVESEINMQRLVARELKNSNLDYEKRKGITDIVFDQLNTSTYGFEGVAGAMGDFLHGRSMASNFAMAVRATNEMVHKPLNSAFKLQNISDNRKAVNARVYNTSSMSNVKSIGMLNGFTGILLFAINPDNTEYVKKTINNIGYNVYEYIADYSKLKIQNPTYFLDETDTPIHYNTIRFNVCNVYGSFPRSKAKQLNEILMSGVKVWFDKSMTEDNLSVG